MTGRGVNITGISNINQESRIGLEDGNNYIIGKLDGTNQDIFTFASSNIKTQNAYRYLLKSNLKYTCIEERQTIEQNRQVNFYANANIGDTVIFLQNCTNMIVLNPYITTENDTINIKSITLDSSDVYRAILIKPLNKNHYTSSKLPITVSYTGNIYRIKDSLYFEIDIVPGLNIGIDSGIVFIKNSSGSVIENVEIKSKFVHPYFKVTVGSALKSHSEITDFIIKKPKNKIGGLTGIEGYDLPVILMIDNNYAINYRGAIYVHETSHLFKLSDVNDLKNIMNSGNAPFTNNKLLFYYHEIETVETGSTTGIGKFQNQWNQFRKK